MPHQATSSSPGNEGVDHDLDDFLLSHLPKATGTKAQKKRKSTPQVGGMAITEGTGDEYIP